MDSVLAFSLGNGKPELRAEIHVVVSVFYFWKLINFFIISSGFSILFLVFFPAHVEIQIQSTPTDILRFALQVICVYRGMQASTDLHHLMLKVLFC